MWDVSAARHALLGVKDECPAGHMIDNWGEHITMCSISPDPCTVSGCTNPVITCPKCLEEKRDEHTWSALHFLYAHERNKVELGGEESPYAALRKAQAAGMLGTGDGPRVKVMTGTIDEVLDHMEKVLGREGTEDLKKTIASETGIDIDRVRAPRDSTTKSEVNDDEVMRLLRAVPSNTTKH